MGDRSNIVIRSGGDRIWPYGHWMGARSIGHAMHGLRSDRVRDAPYLARIVFCSMVGRDTTSEIGFGISTSMVDNQHPVVVIDVGLEATSIWFEDDDGTTISRTFTPEAFVAVAESSTWAECDPFDPNCDHDAHAWPFAPFLAPALAPAEAHGRERST
jgi:hypothetical protein